MKTEKPRFPRDLSPEERAVTEWMIRHGNGELDRRLDELSRATVVWGCDCGCPSVNFAIDGRESPADAGMELFGEFSYEAEGGLYGAFIFESGGQLAGIEFYPLAAEWGSFELPDPESLQGQRALTGFGDVHPNSAQTSSDTPSG